MQDYFLIYSFSLSNSLSNEEIEVLVSKIDASKNDDESDMNNTCYAFGIAPPIEDSNAMTDCDSDQSDGEVTCDPDHLPRRILLTEVLPTNEDTETDKDVAENEAENAPLPSTRTKKSQKKPLPVWKKKYAKEICKCNT